MKITKPTIHFISQSKETEKLYRLEEERSAKIQLAALEWGRLFGHEDKWGVCIPQVLFDTLESFQSDAAIAYLEMKGYTVTKEGK